MTTMGTSRDGIKRSIEVAGACELASFLLVWQKDIDALEHGLNVIRPQIFRVVVGVERGGEAGLLHSQEQFG